MREVGVDAVDVHLLDARGQQKGQGGTPQRMGQNGRIAHETAERGEARERAGGVGHAQVGEMHRSKKRAI